MTTTVRERPILLLPWEVRAILDGRKSQIRRVVKPQPLNPPFSAKIEEGFLWWELNAKGNWLTDWNRCPYGQPGDLLWVRETWTCYRAFAQDVQPDAPVVYRADEDGCGQYPCRLNGETVMVNARNSWKPSVHMPRWASRITLEVKSVRAERLQEISEADALADGGWTYGTCPLHKAPEKSFQHLWQSSNGPGSWDRNAWVWVVEFRRVKP